MYVQMMQSEITYTILFSFISDEVSSMTGGVSINTI